MPEFLPWLLVEVFMPVVATASAFLVVFNVVLALYRAGYQITHTTVKGELSE
ncbi:MAG: hypothetical protein LCI00_05515 [Chloroflexi bacterium]|nr:hypothetical protein [Chloroflexota bacterium]